MRDTLFKKSLLSNQKDNPLRGNRSVGTSVPLYDRFVSKQLLPSREDIMSSLNKTLGKHSFNIYSTSNNRRNSGNCRESKFGMKISKNFSDHDPEFKPDVASFQVNPPNTTLTINRSLCLLTDIQRQNVFKWTE